MEEDVEWLGFVRLCYFKPFYTQKLEIFLLFSRAQKGLEFEYAIEAIRIFVKSLKNASSIVFTLFVSQ